MASLATALRHSCSVRSITLEWNSLGKHETCLQNFLLAVGDNRSLTRLDLRNNEIGQESGPHIAAMLKNT